MGWLPMGASSLVSLSDWQKFLTCQQTGVFAWFPCRSFFQAIVIRSRLKAHCAYMILPYGVEFIFPVSKTANRNFWPELSGNMEY